MRTTSAILLAGLRQLSRSRLVTIPVVLALLYPSLVVLILSGTHTAGKGMADAADAAMGVMFMTIPMAATLATGFIMILGSSLLPEEISAGRAGFWVAQPVSRDSYLAGMTLASFAVCCIVSAILFFGTSAAILAFIPYRPTAVVWAFLCPLLWTAANLALVTVVSLYLPRIASIIICLALAGFSNFMGSVSQVVGALPGGSVASTMQTVYWVSFFVFPADPLLRLAMSGLGPADSSIQMMMSSIGFMTSPPAWQIVYALIWSAAVFLLAGARFRRMDLA